MLFIIRTTPTARLQTYYNNNGVAFEENHPRPRLHLLPLNKMVLLRHSHISPRHTSLTHTVSNNMMRVRPPQHPPLPLILRHRATQLPKHSHNWMTHYLAWTSTPSLTNTTIKKSYTCWKHSTKTPSPSPSRHSITPLRNERSFYASNQSSPPPLSKHQQKKSQRLLCTNSPPRDLS